MGGALGDSAVLGSNAPSWAVVDLRAVVGDRAVVGGTSAGVSTSHQ
jgi:hypothetical protein